MTVAIGCAADVRGRVATIRLLRDKAKKRGEEVHRVFLFSRPSSTTPASLPYRRHYSRSRHNGPRRSRHLRGRIRYRRPHLRHLPTIHYAEGGVFTLPFKTNRALPIAEPASVRIGPAEIALTRIPALPRSVARYRTLASSAALATPITL